MLRLLSNWCFDDCKVLYEVSSYLVPTLTTGLAQHIKVIVHPKTIYDFLSSVEHKKKYSEKGWFQTVLVTIDLH